MPTTFYNPSLTYSNIVENHIRNTKIIKNAVEIVVKVT